MPKLLFQNNAEESPIWVDARFSNGGQPFNELPIAPTFPRWLKFQDIVEIEMSSWSELLYRRSHSTGNISDLHRIAIPAGAELVKGYIWPR